MNRLTRDGTAEPVSPKYIISREQGQRKISVPVQLTTSRTGNLDDHIYIHIFTVVQKTLLVAQEYYS